MLPKAKKNPAEIDGTRNAHIRDGAALTSFLAWLAVEAPKGELTEMSAAESLRAFRALDDRFRGLSFETISGSGPNGAIVHYRVTPETDRGLAPGDVYLVDSGAQYLDGTTDVTRTVFIEDGDGAPSEARERFTRVLKGHIAVASARFPAAPMAARSTRWQDCRLGGGAGLRSRHRPRRRRPSWRSRGAAANFQAGRWSAHGTRHDPVERARLLQARRLRYPH